MIFFSLVVVLVLHVLIVHIWKQLHQEGLRYSHTIPRHIVRLMQHQAPSWGVIKYFSWGNKLLLFFFHWCHVFARHSGTCSTVTIKPIPIIRTVALNPKCHRCWAQMICFISDWWTRSHWNTNHISVLCRRQALISFCLWTMMSFQGYGSEPKGCLCSLIWNLQHSNALAKDS